jgi:hypothetical protein
VDPCKEERPPQEILKADAQSGDTISGDVEKLIGEVGSSVNINSHTQLSTGSADV